jgi:AcrR family transcriptional regulator
MKQAKASGSRGGRPRAFDLDRALEQAMRVFWRKGYEGASLADLTQAMGINRPSLYAAFGDKEALFRKALDRYDTGPSAYVQEALEEKTAFAFVERLLLGAARAQTKAGGPQGCLMVQGALASGDSATVIREELRRRRTAGEALVRRRLQQARASGDLPRDAVPADLARFVVTVIRGMAVQAASGTTRGQLQRVIRTALQAWPG